MSKSKLYELVANGSVEKYPAGQMFYSLDFKEAIYVILKGYVKRVQINENKKRVIESIYGPTYLFPLSQAYRTLFQYNLNQDHVTYIYESMTDVEIAGISADELVARCNSDPMIYKDLFFEAGRRLTANINRLASNALEDDYMKIAHQLIALANEFGVDNDPKKEQVLIPLPLDSTTIAEQVNINRAICEAVIDSFIKQGLIKRKGECYFIQNKSMLMDAYLLSPTVSL